MRSYRGLFVGPSLSRPNSAGRTGSPSQARFDRMHSLPGEHALSSARAAEILAKHGHNQLEEPPPTPAWKRFLSQFKELVVLILIAAAIIAGIAGEWVDTIAILAIVL